MDQAKELLNKVPYSLLAFAALAYMAFDWYQFENAPESPLLMKLAEEQSSLQEVQTLEAKVKKAVEFQRALDAKRAELRALAEELSGLKASLSEEIDVPALIKTVVTEADRIGLRIESFAPTAETKGEFYVEKTFSMKVKGVYQQVVVFLDRLSALNRIIRVDGMDFAPTGPQTARYVDLGGQLRIHAYRYANSKADEIARAEPSPEATSPAGQSAPASPGVKGGGE
ncbi:MAG: type 4a pilus biogenesis protein PilO [Bdellovibrionales bacterium]|nr:type 4a pilus biogenesis protein PilO [Bdellovibrionales bacterium]